jgi:hypothetical protein
MSFIMEILVNDLSRSPMEKIKYKIESKFKKKQNV